MPTKAVAAETMGVGKKRGGKHWTNAEVATRQAAADELKRKKAAALKPPDWLTSEALKIWNRKLKEVEGLNSSEPLLDVLDSESLAIYCDSIVKYKELSCQKQFDVDDHRALQSYARIISAYAERLGFTPAARARLVKKIAEEKEKDKFGAKFDQ